MFPRRCNPHWLGWLLPAALVVCFAGVAAAQSNAPKEPRIFEREPYDILKLKDHDKPLRIKLLPPAERRAGDLGQRKGVLTIRLLDTPDSPYEVGWSNIESIEFFERRVLAEAEALVAADKFDEAYDYFVFLQQEYPETPGFTAAFDLALWREAGALRKAGKHEECFALLLELYARNPGFERLDAAMTDTTQSLLDTAIEQEDFAVARSYAKSLKERFPQSAAVTAAEQRLRDLAAAAVTKSRELIAESGNSAASDSADLMSAAYDQAELALRIWPDEADARQLLVELAERYPRVVVAVTAPVLDQLADGFADRPSARRKQLTGARLAELRGYGPDGAEYASDVAEIEQAELGRKLVINLRPDIRWSADGGELTGVDVARTLLACTRPESATYRPEFAELISGVSVHDVYRVECELSRPLAKPLALLEVELKPGYGEQGSLGAFAAKPAEPSRQRYTIERPSEPAAGAVREIVERGFADGPAALDALRKGLVTVVDRVNPWEVAALRRDATIELAPYATPTLHVLVPNRDRPLVKDRNFRRALVYAIDRQAMLGKLIWRGEIPAGNKVISGPFPAPASTDDSRGYAYNNQVAVRPYDPRLALTLIGVARLAAAPAGQERALAEAEAQRPVPLRMAIPASDVPRLVAKSLARQWKSLGIDLELVEYGSDVTPDALAKCDLVYRELMIREPVAEARRLLGSDGALGSSNAYIDLALLRLLEADNSVAVRDRLRELHRLAAEDATLVPLWQLVDQFAYHKSLSGVGSQPINLYQHVKDWRPAPRLPAGTP